MKLTRFFTVNPFAFILFAYLSGLLIDYKSVYLYLFLCLFSFFLITILFAERRLIKKRIKVIFLALLFSLLGFINSYLNKMSYPDSGIFSSEYFSGRVVQVKTSGSDSIVMLLCDNNSYFNDSVYVSFKGKVKLKCANISLKPGDIISYSANFYDISKGENPSVFSFSQYLKSNGIVAYSKAYECKVIDESTSSLIVCFERIRTRINTIYNNENLAQYTASLMKAMVIGEKSYLNDEVNKIFSKAGIIHILAVSGLHVGLIYLILISIFSFVKSHKAYKIVLFFIIIFLWCYAFIAGFSPSVVRAIIMFSLITFGKILDRHSQILNSVFASAFIVLLFNVSMLFNIGFLLSYSAVISIILFVPAFQTLYEGWSPLLKKVCDIFSVSLAAQIGTFPVIVYYFGQLNLLSVFANLLVVPLVAFFISLSIIFLIPLSILQKILAWILNYIAEFWKIIAGFFSDIDWAIMKIGFYPPQYAYLTVLIILILYIIVNKCSIRNINILLFSSLIFVLTVFYLDYSSSKTKRILIYNSYGNLNVCFYSRINTYFYKNYFNKYDSLNIDNVMKKYGAADSIYFFNFNQQPPGNDLFTYNYGKYFFSSFYNYDLVINKELKRCEVYCNERLLDTFIIASGRMFDYRISRKKMSFMYK